MSKKISIIIPVFNEEKHIEKCIRSLMNQTYKNLEIIIVNDESKDRTLEICEKLKAEDNRIKIINIKNSGVSHSRNVGLENATGDLIGFTDGDDFLEKNYYEKLENEFEKEDNIDIVISGYTEILKDKKTKVNDERRIYNKKEFIANFERIENKNLINTPWNKLIKAEYAKKEKFNENYSLGEDFLYALDVLANCNKICITDYAGYNYRANIKFNYKEIYEPKNFLKRRKLEKEKLRKIGFSENEIEEHYGYKIFRTINLMARNIAIGKFTKKEKKEKYKELLENKELNDLINKKYIKRKLDKITYIVFKLKNIWLMSVYANELKRREKNRIKKCI